MTHYCVTIGIKLQIGSIYCPNLVVPILGIGSPFGVSTLLVLLVESILRINTEQFTYYASTIINYFFIYKYHNSSGPYVLPVDILYISLQFWVKLA